ncbi:helix-turn-helix domain-containing protein [Listeria monocytogenes]|nr:helix-turn-helix domain-containing protein [Listeria monocytogenes]
MNFMTQYEENFKQMIVELNQTRCSVRGLVKEYGLSEATIYKWKNLYLLNQVHRTDWKRSS